MLERKGRYRRYQLDRRPLRPCVGRAAAADGERVSSRYPGDPRNLDIRVIRETEQINEDFAPLVYVLANFVFDKNGKLVFGDGSREYLDKERLAVLLN